MIQPPFLKRGDKIAIVAPARAVSFEEIHPSIKLFQQWGLEVVLGNNVLGKENQYAGNDEKRFADLQQALDDPSVQAIICARGGYGTVRIIDRLDFTGFTRWPKWMIGYSDITVLHSHINRHHCIETLHATMPINIKDEPDNENVNYLRKILFGEKLFYKKPITFLSRTGLSRGELTGGNLSIIYSLMGTPSEIETDGKILFIEDVDEYLYHIDRMMMNLKISGKLDNLKGMIIGGMSDMKDNTIPFGKNALEIVADYSRNYKYPVIFDFPAGHIDANFPLIFGKEAEIKVEKDKATLKYL